MNGDISYLQSRRELSALNRPHYIELARTRKGLQEQKKAAEKRLAAARKRHDKKEEETQQKSLISWCRC